MQRKKDKDEKKGEDIQYDEKVRRMIERWSNKKMNPMKERPERERAEHKLEKTLQGNQQTEEEFVVETKRIPVHLKCEVVVVGGGPAGLSAAIGASRAGAQTVIVEKYGCFGGVITTVGMETLGWYRYEGTSDSEGIGREMERVAKRMGASSKWAYNDSDCLDAERFKMIADELIVQNKVKPLLHTYVVDAIVKENKIVGVITESKSGRRVIYAERVIDCSGDADVAHFAGCRYSTIPIEKSLGVTSVFNASGVDKDKFLKYVGDNPSTYQDWNTGTWEQDTTGKEEHLKSPYLGNQFERAQKEGIIKNNDKDLCLTGSWSALSEAGEATNLNLVHMSGVDTLDAESLTQAEMKGRKGSVLALEALQRVVPGFQHAKLRNFGMTLGVRDSRKIIGRYNLTGDDVCLQGRFEDSIGVFPEFVDGYNILILPTTGRFFQIPYGCLVPDVDNLLVAGRCVSGDIVSHAATRNMMCCTVTGQGAGVAAAVSIREKTTTQHVDVKKVQEELKKQGARIQ